MRPKRHPNTTVITSPCRRERDTLRGLNHHARRVGVGVRVGVQVQMQVRVGVGAGYGVRHVLKLPRNIQQPRLGREPPLLNAPFHFIPLYLPYRHPP